MGNYNPFRGVQKVAGIVGGNFFPPGFNGDVETESIKTIISKNPKTSGDNKFIANFKVITCDVDKKSPGYVEPGSKRDWIVNLGQGDDDDNMSQKKQMGLNNVKAYAAVALDIPVEAVDDDILIGMANKAQTAKGSVLRLRTSTIQTRNNTPFTLHNFEPALGGGTEDLEDVG